MADSTQKNFWPSRSGESLAVGQAGDSPPVISEGLELFVCDRFIGEKQTDR